MSGVPKLFALIGLLLLLCSAQTTANQLSQLESLGVQLLSNVLSPSAAASTSSSSSSSSTSSSSSSSITSSALVTSSLSLNRASSSSPSASATAAADSSPNDPKNRNLAIILGTVLGFVVVVLLAAFCWLCCFRKGKRTFSRTSEKHVDDDGLEPWRQPAPLETAYVTRIESWHEPRTSRTSLRGGPPRGSQSHVSIVQRDVPDRYSNDPPTSQVPIAPPHRMSEAPRHNSQYGLIQNENPFDDPPNPYADRPERHSMDDASRNPTKYPGYVPYRSTQSLVDRKPIPQRQSVAERSPTPLFGSGKTPGETMKRHSDPENAPVRSYNTGPSPRSNGGGPWVPPKNPGRRRESVPGSPLAHEFDFDFDDKSRRPSDRRTSSGTSGGNSIYQDAHHRF